MAFDFRCTLLREKFTLSDPSQPGAEPAIALSNRIVLPLSRDEAGDIGQEREDFIVRTQSMHTCARFAAAIWREFLERGAIMSRGNPFNWQLLWNDVVRGYERDWNPSGWCAVYHKGRIVFSDGERHPFLDIVEKCDAASGDDYAGSILFAESAFLQAGHAMNIDHDSNVALVITVNDTEARCGLILRVAERRTTFNYMVKPNGSEPRDRLAPTILASAAAFLEGIQLAFFVGVARRKDELGLVEKYSDEARKARRDAERLLNLSGAIETYERKHTFHYRPERPNFQELVAKAEELAVASQTAGTATVKEPPPPPQ